LAVNWTYSETDADEEDLGVTGVSFWSKPTPAYGEIKTNWLVDSPLMVSKGTSFAILQRSPSDLGYVPDYSERLSNIALVRDIERHRKLASYLAEMAAAGWISPETRRLVVSAWYSMLVACNFCIPVPSASVGLDGDVSLAWRGQTQSLTTDVFPDGRLEHSFWDRQKGDGFEVEESESGTICERVTRTLQELQ